MSEITTRIQQMNDGQVPWPELRDWLAHHTYVTPQRYDKVDRVGHAVNQDDWDNVFVDGSWDEVERAFNTGKLTRAQYFELSKQIDRAAGRR